MIQPKPPIRFAVYWGSEPSPEDTPDVMEFADEAQAEAWFRGVSEADGWMDAAFVPHARFCVDNDGEIVEALRGQGAPPARAEVVHVIWGEAPEVGSTPDSHEFQTAAQAEAFVKGAQGMVGWTRYFLVPDENFRAYPSATAAIEDLEGDARRTFEYHLQEDGGGALEGLEEERVFVRADGAFVDGDWAPGAPIHNTPLSPAQWRAGFEAALKEGYNITVVDAGLDEKDLAKLAKGFHERMPGQAARAYADKYDLTPTAPASRLAF